MIYALKQAHERMTATLPVRTHHAKEPPKKPARGLPRVLTGAGRGAHNKIGLRIGGKLYACIRDVKKEFHVGQATIAGWIRAGHAVRVSE